MNQRTADNLTKIIGSLENDAVTAGSSECTRTTDDSWQRRLELALQRIKDLTEENKQLRTQLALAHGQPRADQIASVRTLSTRQTP
jgi:cell shape-determining protein MreC